MDTKADGTHSNDYSIIYFNSCQHYKIAQEQKVAKFCVYACQLSQQFCVYACQLS